MSAASAFVLLWAGVGKSELVRAVQIRRGRQRALIAAVKKIGKVE
jgi:hypothetical protein